MSDSHANCVPREDHAALMQHLNHAYEANRRLATEIGGLRKRIRVLEEEAALKGVDRLRYVWRVYRTLWEDIRRPDSPMTNGDRERATNERP